MSESTAPAIVVDRLGKRFGAFAALEDVSFSVGRGEITGFLGPNGAGKSTLIRLLCGLLRPSSGRALVTGIDIATDPERVRRRIGYMLQKFSPYSDLSVIENLRFFGGIYGVESRLLEERIRFAIEIAGLQGREGTLVDPLRYCPIIIRGTFLKGVGLDVLWPPLLALASIGITLLAASMFRFRKALD